MKLNEKNNLKKKLSDSLNLNGSFENSGQISALQKLVGVDFPGKARYETAVSLGHMPGSNWLNGPDRILETSSRQTIASVVPARIQLLQ